MDIVRVGGRTLKQFELLITAEGLEQISSNPGSSLVMGAVVDGLPVGAAVVSVEPPIARMSSLYVEDEFRRQGIGGALCGRLINDIVVDTDLDSLIVPFTEEADGDVFKSFFESLYFEIEKVGEDSTIKAGEALMLLHKKKIGDPSSRAIAVNKLKSTEKRLLLNLDTDLSGYISKKQIREDFSYVILDKSGKSIEACVIIAELEGELVLVWAQTKSGSPDFLKMIGNSMEMIEENEDSEKIIHVPTINEQSAQLVSKLFGNRCKTGTTSYVAYF